MPKKGAAALPGFADAGGFAPEPEPHYLGHRARLQERLLNGGAEALPDYEILEVLLSASNPRGDTKPLAKALIAHFGGFAAVLSADPDALRSVRADGRGLGNAGSRC